MIIDDIYKYTRPNRTGIRGSIKEGTSTRFEKAKDEKKKFEHFNDKFPSKSEKSNHILKLTNEFLGYLEIDTYPIEDIMWTNLANDILQNKKKTREFYENLKQKYKLNDERHLVWMKFTKSGCLGVVAAGADVNFDTENTSGKIVSYVDEEWDEDLILIFPLPKIGFGYRRDIECGIGNYLLESGVPILDRYSHMY